MWFYVTFQQASWRDDSFGVHVAFPSAFLLRLHVVNVDSKSLFYPNTAASSSSHGKFMWFCIIHSWLHGKSEIKWIFVQRPRPARRESKVFSRYLDNKYSCCMMNGRQEGTPQSITWLASIYDATLMMQAPDLSPDGDLCDQQSNLWEIIEESAGKTLRINF